MRLWPGPPFIVSAVIAVLAFLLCVLVRPFSDFGMLILSDTIQLAAGLASAAVIVWRSRRATGLVRLGWLCIAGVGATFAAGMIPWIVYEVFLHRPVPFPSLADVGFLSGVPLGLAGVLCLTPRPRGVAWARAAIDLVLAAGLLLFLVWLLVVEASVEGGELNGIALTIAVAYPVGYAVLGGVALRSVVDTGLNRRAMSVLVLGLGTQAAVSVMYLYLLGRGAYHSGHVIDPLFPTALLLLAYASLQPDALRPPGPAQRARAVRRAVALAPVLLVVPVALLQGGVRQVDLMAPVAVAALGAVAVRQSLAFLEQRQVAQDVSQAAARARLMSSRMSDAMLMITPDGRMPLVSPSLERFLGLRRDEIVVARLAELIAPEDRASLGELYGRAMSSGVAERARLNVLSAEGWRPVEVELTLAQDEEFGSGVLVVFRDVSEQVEAERSLERAARIDPLTSLPNREVFLERLERAIAEGSAADGELVVLVVDLDHFKTINDSLGHRVGDGLLVVAAHRLVEALPDCFVGRLGGDEFGVLSRQSSPRVAEDLAAAALQAFREPLPIAGLDLVMHCSVGVARGRDGWQGDDLLQAADTALYAAKSEGRDRLAVFTEMMGAAVRERLTLNSALPRALEGGELELWYQPLVTLRTGNIASFEALLRWRSPQHGLVSPVRFIPLAEESGHIVEIGRWALGEACRQLAAWRSAHSAAAELSVAVNVSGRQMSGEGIALDVDAAIRAAGIPARALTIEVTESLTLSEDAPAVLGALRDLGVRIAMDDFGTGYSSLASLQRLPFDILKLDRAFLTSLDTGPGRGTSFLKSIVAMAHSLDLVTVAEGVETTEHLRVLREAGLDKAQGYLFGRPVPAGEAEQLLIAGGRLTGPE